MLRIILNLGCFYIKKTNLSQENFDIKYNICGKTLTGQPMCNPYRQSMRRTTLPSLFGEFQLELLEICFLRRLSSCWDFVINLNPVLLHKQYISDEKSVQKCVDYKSSAGISLVVYCYVILFPTNNIVMNLNIYSIFRASVMYAFENFQTQFQNS